MTSIDTVCVLPENTSLDPVETGANAIREVGRFIESLPHGLASSASHLMDRHGYAIGSSGEGPHSNVLGQPLFELPIWIDSATDDVGMLGHGVMQGICFSSLFGYLSVRADDDYFDGHWDDPGAAMMLSTVFRIRHQTLLAEHTDHRQFWGRFEELWRGYAEAMLVEASLHDAKNHYGPAEFDLVLNRSQPLEIPAIAVLALKDRWEEARSVTLLVGHLAKATQIFDDFVDAPQDLASGNYTWMVRRLGGLDGDASLRQGMVQSCDRVIAEVVMELDRAVAVGSQMGIVGLEEWVEDRKDLMLQASNRMYQVVFDRLRSAWESVE